MSPVFPPHGGPKYKKHPEKDQGTPSGLLRYRSKSSNTLNGPYTPYTYKSYFPSRQYDCRSLPSAVSDILLHKDAPVPQHFQDGLRIIDVYGSQTLTVDQGDGSLLLHTGVALKVKELRFHIPFLEKSGPAWSFPPHSRTGYCRL